MANIQAKLRKVTLSNETLSQFCERKVKEKSKSIRNKGLEKSGYNDWVEAFNDLCDDYLLLDDTLFKVLSMKEDEHFLLINHNTDGTIDIAMDFHGSSSWLDNFDESDIELLKK